MVYVKKIVMQGFKSFARKTEVPFDEGINIFIGPNGSGKSCSYDTIVTLANGDEIELGKLVEEQVAKANQVKTLEDGIYVGGDALIEILSLNKETMKCEKKQISKFIKRKGEEIYKIRTRTGRELKATGSHPIMSFVNEEVYSRLIQDLKEGSLIACPRVIEIDANNEIDVDFARLIGYIIGDGYIAKDRIEFVNNDKEIIEDYIYLIKKFSNGDLRRRFDKNVTRIYIRDKDFVKKIRDLFYKDYNEPITSLYKKIPSNLLKSNKEGISNLLAGLYDTDGSVRKDIGIIEYCTKNRDLARQIQRVCSRFEILSKIKKRKSKAFNTINKIERDYYYIYIYGNNNLDKFYSAVPLRCTHKSNNIKNHLDRKVISNPNIDILPKEINNYVRELSHLLGIRVKPLKKVLPFYESYVEDRCLPTRQGINKLITLFNDKLTQINNYFSNIQHEQLNLIEGIKILNISGMEASRSIGLNEAAIMANWATQRFSPRPQNLDKFYSFVSNAFLDRASRIKDLMALLYNIANSDIYWDEIVSIEKLPKEEWVYDLTIEDNHNFIANNIFAHNSNVADAICFVLGRLSAKSMRAEKSKSLIFMGSKYIKPAKEAFVEIVFDNSDKTFAMDMDEVTLSRAVKHNGQGVYKINGDTKTRAEVIETLAQAGIDPYGFNLILQGQIQSIVKMHGEERRKIIEEVAGISVYEWRKEKSLKELEKTEERLKEISAVLRERTAYLNNLEKERSQARRYQELKLTEKRARGSILKRKIDDKKKEANSIVKAIEEKMNLKDKKQEKMLKIQDEIDELTEKINQINKHIRESSGVEQGKLRDEITSLKAELEGLRVRKEGYEHRKEEVERRIEEMQKTIPEIEKEIKVLREKSPSMAKKAEELRKKKEELAELEKERKRAFSLKTEINAIRDRIEDKKKELTRSSVESEELLKQMESLSKDFRFNSEKECESALKVLREQLLKNKKEIEESSQRELLSEKTISVSESEIKSNREIKEKVEKIDTCPLCQTKITEEHIDHVFQNCDDKIKSAEENLESTKKELQGIVELRLKARKEIEEREIKIRNAEMEHNSHKSINEKKEIMKKLVERISILKTEVNEMENKKKLLENKIEDVTKIEEKYSNKALEIEEISSRTEEDIDTTLLYKEREVEKTRSIIERGKEDFDTITTQIDHIIDDIENKEEMLSEKEDQEKKLNEKFNKMFVERDKFQKNVQETSIKLNEMQSEIRQIEDQANYLKIGKAKIDGEKEALEVDFLEYSDIEILLGNIANLEERLKKTQETLMTIGSINMRALEVYDKIKEEYDAVRVKVETLENEKTQIMSIVEEIDKKKSKTFIKTYKAINELFSSNFFRLFSKGTAYLDIENKENIFEGGIDIVVKMAKGKYFDITSLSGGEQTLIALSLLFAIQKYKPYHFYIFDEIDAALDKRNSERLAALLNQYMKSGQYIIVTHNDAVILNSQVLYGVSMHEGVSRVLSLRVENESLKNELKQEEVVENQEVEEVQKLLKKEAKENLEEELDENSEVFEESEKDENDNGNLEDGFEEGENPLNDEGKD